MRVINGLNSFFQRVPGHYTSTGALWKKLLKTLFVTHNSVFETPGEKPGGSRAARFVGAALEPPGFSPGVLKTELRRLNVGDEKGVMKRV
jgi:hypothetical protein